MGVEGGDLEKKGWLRKGVTWKRVGVAVEGGDLEKNGTVEGGDLEKSGGRLWKREGDLEKSGGGCGRG